MKILKTALIVILVLVIVLGVVVLVIYPRGDEYVEKTSYPYANWMTDTIKGDAKLVDIVMPGAHDAGAADLDGSVMQIARYLLVCQNSTILEQLKCGVRYFDLRTMLDNDELYIQHGDYKTQKFSTVVDNIDSYLGEYSDPLILNFQHFTDDAAAQATYEYLVANVESFVDICVNTSTPVDSITLNYLQEKGKRLIVLWGRDLNPNTEILFRDIDDVLYSPYVGDVHAESDEALIAQFATYIQNSKEKHGFFNLQCQRTWGSHDPLKGPEQLEKIFADKANQYIASISDEDLKYINIIHRDFVTTGEKIKTIIDLNTRKGLTK